MRRSVSLEISPPACPIPSFRSGPSPGRWALVPHPQNPNLHASELSAPTTLRQTMDPPLGEQRDERIVQQQQPGLATQQQPGSNPFLEHEPFSPSLQRHRPQQLHLLIDQQQHVEPTLQTTWNAPARRSADDGQGRNRGSSPIILPPVRENLPSIKHAFPSTNFGNTGQTHHATMRDYPFQPPLVPQQQQAHNHHQQLHCYSPQQQPHRHQHLHHGQAQTQHQRLPSTPPARYAYPSGFVPPFASQQQTWSDQEHDQDQGGSPPTNLKAKRKRATPHQLALLNDIFDHTFFPSTELRNAIGKELSMVPRTVQIWFQNRRQSWRSQRVKDRDESDAINDDERGGWEVLRKFQVHSRAGEDAEYAHKVTQLPLISASSMEPSMTENPMIMDRRYQQVPQQGDSSPQMQPSSGYIPPSLQTMMPYPPIQHGTGGPPRY